MSEVDFEKAIALAVDTRILSESCMAEELRPTGCS
jgi:hypothetical protein